MFILRKIGSINNHAIPPRNFWLGKSYTYVHKEQTPDEFIKFEREVGMINSEESIEDDRSLYAYVFDENGDYFPLWKHERNFIMTEKGNTFENLTFK